MESPCACRAVARGARVRVASPQWVPLRKEWPGTAPAGVPTPTGAADPAAPGEPHLRRGAVAFGV